MMRSKAWCIRAGALGVLLMMIVTGICAQAVAADVSAAYATPRADTFLKTLIRFGAISMADDDAIDQYAMVEECGIHHKYYQDDFAWQRVRKALRESIRKNVMTFPTGFYYDAQLQLDRYDFKTGIFRFTDKSVPSNVNAFIFTADKPICYGWVADLFPKEYGFVLEDRLSIPGLPLSQEEAKTLLERMTKDGNTDRLIYARFDFRVRQIDRLVRARDGHGDRTQYFFQEGGDTPFVKIISHLDAVRFYEDQARTRLIYAYEPM